MAKKNRQLALHGFGAADAGPSQPTATTGGRQPAAPAGHDRRQVPPANLKGKSVYVIDAHSLIFQVFHAIGEMTSPDGEPVTAIYGFARDLLYLIEEKKPDFLLCAFDLPGSTFRHEIYQPYKADRGEMPDDLRVQFPVIREMLELLGVPVLQYENHEADDVLASVARICDQAGAQCFVVTGDKDCRQLITDNVKIYNIRKDQVFDRAALEKEWGIRPEQVVDFQALVGDATDNVPGVPLIGPKLAQQLLEKYGTLDEVLDHADEVSGAKRQENLRQGREIALLSRQLVRLVDDLPMTVDWSTARPSLDHAESAVALFRRLGFRGLTDRLVALAGLQMRDEWVADYQCVGGEEDLRRLAQQLSQQSQISVDVETTSVLPRFAELVGCSVAWEPGKAWYLPVRAPAGEKCLDTQEVLNALRPVLENPAIQKIGQNLKYDMIVLRAAGIRLAGVAFDSMLASYLIEAGQRNHNLDALALRYLQHETTKISELIGGGKQQKQMDQVPLDQITPYAAEDVDVPLRLRPILEERLIELGLDQLNRELEVPLISVLADMEYAGIKLDIEHLSRLSVQYQQQLDALEAEIYDLAGHPFNIASPKQLATVLFTEQGLPVLKKTKTGPSTDGEVLEQLAANHPLPAKIIEYRQFAKLKNTYVDALPALVHPQTGRIHATFHQVVTATGRLSSSDPNLQNIPVRAERGREIRAAFLPGPPDWQLLAADYSQIELRVLAHYSKDEALCEAFARDEDVHKMVASQVYGVPPSKVTVEMRRGAKAVNFGVIYGQTAFGLAKSLGIEVDEAAEFIDAYFAKYPRVEEFLRQVLADCRQAGYVTTILGRRRNISGVREEVIGRQLNFAERTAINTIIQGSAADMIKQAMVNIHRRLEKENRKSQMLLQIHDELVFEVPPQELDAMQQLVPAEMGSAV
ncbi:MAG: DNA polymerase I, partial [Planctomycetales bacterium]|nr:DNA polymerase I [Planctomycetales bacterium]NIM08659.1 DNA polymerase I [Planctomycetales bacterium]NIN08129.1 DNA polymerase I [Planctomycetales bacterium]NIN77254.1 DNA polymerase I [Planctomycetales bacterium]NIO34443.1 DNA polymerase I [Planctomycetales bacterium]